jgi:hypothetical protein
MSTVIKTLDLDVIIEYCDGSIYNTPVTNWSWSDRNHVCLPMAGAKARKRSQTAGCEEVFLFYKGWTIE